MAHTEIRRNLEVLTVKMLREATKTQDLNRAERFALAAIASREALKSGNLNGSVAALKPVMLEWQEARA